MLTVYTGTLVGICLFVCSCTWYTTGRMELDQLTEYKNEGFSLQHPKNVVVQKETPVEDFNIYKFLYNKDTLLSAYVGNQPSFKPDVEGIISQENGFINALPFERIRTREPNGTIRVEVLIKFSEGRDGPMFMHFWYFDLPSDLETVAEKIIASTREL